LQQIHQNTKKTILFITHDIREAACLGDRVIVLSYRPARIKKEFIVDLPRERRIDDPDLQIVARAILEELKEEVRLAARDRVRKEAFW
jgi:NitT/TauT family transport system ATP-binding protein